MTDITSPYTWAQGVAYETLVAPAVLEAHRALADPLLDGLARGAHLLDVGAGAGKISVLLAERRPDLRITGIDQVAHQVTRAERTAAHLAGRVRFQLGSALALPFEDASFDAVLSCGSIKHWPDRARGLAECARVLRPGGPLLITEADRGCRFEDARDFVRSWPAPAPIRPLLLAMFRTWVAGQSLDLDEARALASDLGLRETVVERVAGAPLLRISARR